MINELDDLLGPVGGAPVSKSAPRPDSAEPDAIDFLRPVSIGFLARAFRANPQTVEKRLAECPVKEWAAPKRGRPKPLYDFCEAAAYLVKPRVDLVKYLSSLNSNNIPPHINKTFWDSMNARAKYEATARMTWRDEDVLSVLGATAMLIRERTLLWVDQLPDKVSLTQENRQALRDAVDDLLEDIKVKLEDMPKKRRTESVVAQLDEHLEGGVNVDPEDFLVGDYGEGERLLRFKTPFLKRWFHIDTRTFKAEPRDYAFGEIMPRVKDIMFSLDPADYPQLPPYQVVPIRVRLPDEVMKAYRKFKREMVSEEYDVEAVNGGVLHGKLLQFANGSMFREDGEDVPIHDVKIDALKTLVQELNGTPLLVAYTYRFDVERIMKAFPKAVHLTPENASTVVRDWNADRIPLLLCHRASAGHGLNMQKGTGHMCEYGLTADAELYLQFLKRIWRPGRKGTLFNHVIMSEGTIDDEIFPQYLDPKILTQMRVMEAVRVSFQQDALLSDLL